MRVLLTVDTELSSSSHRPEETKANLQSAIFGGKEGRFGIPYQLDMLDRYGLKAVFFVEALSANVVGFDVLRKIVDPIRSAGHEIQLHVHTEWLRYYDSRTLRWLEVSTVHNNIGQFPYNQQFLILKHALSNLLTLGISSVTAFRAGNYGANIDTLKAIAALGLSYDSSYNVYFADDRGPCKVSPGTPLEECRKMGGVIEVPITHFHDRIFGLRHLQLCSISLAEMRSTLSHASDAQRNSAVIISHSFELLNRSRTRANPIHVKRFVGLCEFLAERNDGMSTAGFGDLEPSLLCGENDTLLQSSPILTMHRVSTQLLGRAYG